MIKQFSFLIALGLLALSAKAQTTYKYQIEQNIGGMVNANTHFTINTTVRANDGYYVMGNLESYDDNGTIKYDVFVAHLDEHGQKSSGAYWFNTYGFSGTKEYGNHMIRDYAGNLVILAETHSNANPSVITPWIFSVDANGIQLVGLSKKLTNSGADDIRGLEIIRLLDNRAQPDGFAICGYVGDGTDTKGFVAKLDNSFNVNWYRDYIRFSGNKKFNTRFNSLIEMGAPGIPVGGNFIVVGSMVMYSYPGPTTAPAVGCFIEVDRATGAIVQMDPLSTGPADFHAINFVSGATEVIKTGDGGFLIGSTPVAAPGALISNYFYVHRFSSARTLQWSTKYEVNGVPWPLNIDLQVEDIIQFGNDYNVLLSSVGTYYLVRIQDTHGQNPLGSRQFVSGSTGSEFNRFTQESDRYQKLSFDRGMQLPAPGGNGFAFACGFNEPWVKGLVPANGDGIKFRLHKTDMSFGAGDPSCDIVAEVEEDCSWSISNPTSCTQLSPSTFQEDWNYGHTNGQTFFASTVIMGQNHYCNEVAYDLAADNATPANFKKDPTSIEQAYSAQPEVLSTDLNGGYIIKTDLEITNAWVFDINGKEVMQVTGSTLDLQSQKPGMYLLKLEANNQVFTYKLMRP